MCVCLLSDFRQFFAKPTVLMFLGDYLSTFQFLVGPGGFWDSNVSSLADKRQDSLLSP